MVLIRFNFYFLFTILKIVINSSIVVSLSGSKSNGTYKDMYEMEWMYFPDGMGQPHAINLKSDVFVPLSKTPVQLEFRRYRRNVDSYILLDSHANVLTKSVRTSNLFMDSIKIITHGWRSSIESISVKAIKEAYVATQDVDVITVDWSEASRPIAYFRVARSTKSVGEEIAEFLDALNKQFNVNGDQIHLIGHSLGAHVMGVAGSKSKLTIGRITGLDPARPHFEFPSRKNADKLDSGDATFVDIIHTCSGALGIASVTGTVDFYPNGGSAPQPGCERNKKIMDSCSHSKAPQYFAESIRSPHLFPAYKCLSWSYFLQNRCDEQEFMGEHVDLKAQGVYYLRTKADVQPSEKNVQQLCAFANLQ